MEQPVLATKLYVPPLRGNLVSRQRLLLRLEDGLRPECRLILTSAPAGFGKTTLLSEWALQLDSFRVRWLSIDEGDNDSQRFFTYFASSLQDSSPTPGETLAGFLLRPSNPDSEAGLTALINTLSNSPEPLVVVLDDYHLISNPSIHRATAFLIDHLPPHIRLVLATRSDPPLPLARLRARGQLIELRAPDLRFTPEEAAEFLNRTMGLALSASDVSALETRTEGWIAGLQLAAISLQGRTEPSGFITSFTGSNRYVIDYLVEEVLRRLLPEEQVFLQKTCILNRLSAPLCNFITDRSDSQQILEKLEANNLFLIPLDQERTWYRYHNLFAEFLRTSFYKTSRVVAEELPWLHALASKWFEAEGQHTEAIEHALLAGDFERGASLIEPIAPSILTPGESGTLMRWMEKIPRDIMKHHPYLYLVKAWGYMIAGDTKQMEEYIQKATENAPPENRALRGEIDCSRSVASALAGDTANTIQYAYKALENLPEDNHLLRDMVQFNLGMAYEVKKDYAAARQAYESIIFSSQRNTQGIYYQIAYTQLADIYYMQGRLHTAGQTLQQALDGPPAEVRKFPVFGMNYMRLGQLYYEWNDLEGAIKVLKTANDMGKRWETADIYLTVSIFLAMVLHASGDQAGSLEYLRQSEALVQNKMISSSTIRSCKALLAQLYLRRNEVERAAFWMEDYRANPQSLWLDAFDTERTTLVRVMLAQGQTKEALKVIEEGLKAAGEYGASYVCIELKMLEALALEDLGQTEEALEALKFALEIAQPEGFIRTFLDEGEPILHLLRLVESRKIQSGYVHKLLQAAGEAPSPAVLTTGLAEPLSERELEVLALLVEGLPNSSIAKRLIITLGTVKRHVSNIYAKLNVNTRTQAASRARQLGLIH